MSNIVHRSSDQISEMLDWFEQGSPFRMRGFSPIVRVEDFVEDDTYVVRAELPGIDPDKDVQLEVKDDALTIRGERQEEEHDKLHHEFRYGSFSRTIPLSRGVNADDVKATYANGVLEVRIPRPADSQQSKRIPIERSTVQDPAAESPTVPESPDTAKS